MKQRSNREYKRYKEMCVAAGITPEVEPVEEAKERWAPPEQPYFFNQFGNIYKTTANDHTNIGRERSTESLCKIASDRTIRVNRISAWLDSEGSGEQEYSENKTLYSIWCTDGVWSSFLYSDKVAKKLFFRVYWLSDRKSKYE